MRTKQDIERDIAAAQTRLDNLYAQLNSAPDWWEPEVGSVIQFDVQYDPCGTVYKYIAYHHDQGRWTVGGKASTSWTWADLLALIGKDHAVRSGHRKPSFRVAKKWVEK